jgi:copper homeostasis protein
MAEKGEMRGVQSAPLISLSPLLPGPRFLLEAAVDSVGDAERAVREGAGRLEVCADLDQGGLTPPPALLTACLALGLPCVAMVRPRPGDFVYTDVEMERLMADASALLEAGAHGIVFGCLHRDGGINEDDVLALVRLAENAHTVFHRAFDETPDAGAALATLMQCGVTRVLTSGHAATAIEGAAELADLIGQGRGRIGVLPGGGVRAANVVALVDRTGTTEVHARASTAGVIAGLRAALTGRPPSAPNDVRSSPGTSAASAES